MKALRTFKTFLAAAVIGMSALLSAPLVQAQSVSDFWENKVIDVFIRAQSYTIPTTHYYALATTSGSDSACGTEVIGGNYARVAITASLTNYAGTQSAGSTSASSGTGGQTSNNIAIGWTSPTTWTASVTEYCVFDASSGGNLLWRVAITGGPKTVNTGDTVSFAIAASTFTIQ